MKSTVEGIERGHFLTGPLEPGGRKYLFCVTRVLGKHSVLAVTNMGKMVCEINLATHGIHKEDSDWKKVIFTETALHAADDNFGGIVIDNSYMQRHAPKPVPDA